MQGYFIASLFLSVSSTVQCANKKSTANLNRTIRTHKMMKWRWNYT